MGGIIRSLNVATPQPAIFHGREVMTGIYKSPVEGPVFLARDNFEGDRQADLINHGGPDKAVCVYPDEHYAYWQQELQMTLPPGTFGENLTVSGIRETEVCIGDIYQLGEAVVQVSQPRQPCYKLAGKLGVADMVARVQSTGYTGYYFRVLQEGRVSKGDALRLLARDTHGITVMFANRIKYHDQQNRDAIHRILEVEALAESWRQSFRKRLAAAE
ncbi:MOSC domain-containing protein [Brevibacillus sp. SYP-B805]|uniref:MOSC domain-containing protein n=1 Tax=Brevibacillus sp. SYP-B805 TaxID=1578199 RepID=UPI0013EDD676|nr:MOSC domain-containing protein [Brevibacillus sp. SYP-B805]NGQ97330.1 MOSC domain-containing protein [Brevibacillus sp. SYP-B805]